ncbi:hypothetical protein K493DRAFT_320290 [Basidiobolus meristosporus CBS 931.73]|uniref:Uncharacterized protein n=1 Tax=Basidiobolus meristosporus CBS 931.73 TaxID=1314790 RepID=A0A1Y1XBZ3_9FUNG|nr:hypothetical protein K493DRAFT_320290 [Basidiobolus meristosporus CBS 931.73]|eukprot:ORX83258.1 hypothetical protein K493DRAFT_320290 [Basidiobolus meristosporus CBS 931.73]
MISQPFAPQIVRPSCNYFERPHSPNGYFAAQPIPTKHFGPISALCDSPILAPSPKKMSYRGGSICSEHDDFFPWELPTLSEDSDEDSYDGDSLSEHSEADESSEAFAELFSIIHKPASPLFHDDRNELFDLHDTDDSDSQGPCDYLCRSPISRTQNPLPLDTMFHNIPENQVYNSGHLDVANESGSTLSAAFSKLDVNDRPINASFEKLRVRPRSHSVGAKPVKRGVMF